VGLLETVALEIPLELTLSASVQLGERKIRRYQMSKKLVGRYIVTDPNICHGKPTFRGTRIFVSDVLEQVASGMAWETIIEEWHNSITEEAITEAVRLASQAFLEHVHEYVLEPTPA
jgi:uncharacterized protein (DUF433 family)